MSGPLSTLAREAAELRSIPPDLLGAARALHLAVAAVPEGLRPRWADAVLGGRVGAAIPRLWQHEVDCERLFSATVVGLEVGARVGLARLLAPHPGEADPRPAAAAAAVAGALLAGRDPANALVEAMGGEAEAGTAFWEGCAAPLPGAFTELGRVWLSRSLSLASGPGSPWLAVAIEAVHEVLRRHVRAAEKRLRPDQVDRLEIRVCGWTADADAAAAPEDRIAHQVGRLVATYERDGDGDPDGASAVAERVLIQADPRLSLRAATALAASLGGLVGGRALLKAAPSVGVVDPLALPALLRERPDRVLRALLREPGTLAGAEPAPWALPVEVKLYTTRGGWWPERRALPEGTLAGKDLEYNAIERWARGDDARRAQARALLDRGGPAQAWLEEARA